MQRLSIWSHLFTFLFAPPLAAASTRTKLGCAPQLARGVFANYCAPASCAAAVDKCACQVCFAPALEGHAQFGPSTSQRRGGGGGLGALLGCDAPRARSRPLASPWTARDHNSRPASWRRAPDVSWENQKIERLLIGPWHLSVCWPASKCNVTRRYWRNNNEIETERVARVTRVTRRAGELQCILASPTGSADDSMVVTSPTIAVELAGALVGQAAGGANICLSN